MVVFTFIQNTAVYFCLFTISCNYFPDNNADEQHKDTVTAIEPEKIVDDVQNESNNTVTAVVEKENKDADTNVNADVSNPITAEQLLAYAKTLIGTPYKYASVNPVEGLDCSGFITHVFNHFLIAVPRSSVDFTNYGIPVSSANAEPGDLILFTGTDSTSKVVGHMGIVTGQTDGILQFIHSTSGKAYGVTISTLTTHYVKRFVKVIRVKLYRNMKQL